MRGEGERGTWNGDIAVLRRLIFRLDARPLGTNAAVPPEPESIMTTRPFLALMAIALAAPLGAQVQPPTAPSRAAVRAKAPELTAEQRTKLRALQDRQRDARRAVADQRTTAKRKQQDELRAILTPEQFQAMRGRLAQRGQTEARGGRGGAVGRGGRGGAQQPRATAGGRQRPGAVRGNQRPPAASRGTVRPRLQDDRRAGPVAVIPQPGSSGG